MTNREKMIKYLAKVEEVNDQLEVLAPVIQREAERRFGRKIQAARSTQERENLRQYYTVQVGRENIWKQTYLSNRDLYIRLTTMYASVALVQQTGPPPTKRSSDV